MSIIFKTFRTYAHPYVYDRHTNAVMMLNEDEYKELVAVEKGELAADDSLVIKHYQEQGLFKQNTICKIEHSSTIRLEPYLGTRIQQLVLQVTQQCNLRCEYCVYSGIYGSNRTHNNSKMTFETAKKAIDYFLDHNRELSRVIIGFYGGEPLLEFQLIKKCVEYARNKVEGKHLIFNMTTNGTLLSDEIIDYLVENKFLLSISLDGSKREHDVSRKFRDGTGSFDVIIKNIQKIRNKYPDYDEHIQIMTTVNPYMDVGCVMEYFKTDDIFADKSIVFNTMNEQDLKEEAKYSDSFYRIRNYEYIKFLFYMIGMLEQEYISPLVINSYTTLRQYQDRLKKHSEIGSVAHHNGPCVPGVRKLFVRVDGKLFPCERINETKDYFCIGSVDKGILIEKAERILNIGKLSEQACKECWAIRHCSICAAQLSFEDNPTAKDKLALCRSMRLETLYYLYELSVLNEFGFDPRRSEVQ